MDEKEKKATKRLFKELGIYHIWIKNRKEYCGNCSSLRYFWHLSTNLSELIDESFTWSATGQEGLWEELNMSPYANYQPSEIIQNKLSLKGLKEICDYFLK